ncbi:MAG: hypothetical protein R6V67_09905, partial [Spirochaetia bacterium]
MSTYKFTQNRKFFSRLAVLMGGLLLIAAAPLAAQDSFFDEEGEEEAESGGSSSLQWSGEVSLTTRTFLDWDWENLDWNDIDNSPKIGWPQLRLDAEYEGEYSKAVGSLEYSARQPIRTGEDLINEAYFTLYYDNFDLSTGYMKQVWGTTDGVHVVDRLNPIDYTDFVMPDYLDRNIAEKMVKLDFYTGDQGKVELAYVPIFSPHRFSTDPEGRWTPGMLKELHETLGNTEYENFLATLQEETADNSLGDGQYGLRYSDSAGGFDFGATYYFGFMREPTPEWDMSDPNPANWTIDSVHFDRMHLFGVEGATVVKGFNMRAEAGYIMTDDFGGDESDTYNPRIEYIAGFDRNLPLSNLNIQLQNVGSYIMFNDKIKEPAQTTPQVDPDYDADGDYTSNTVTLRVSDSYVNDTVKPEIRGSY